MKLAVTKERRAGEARCAVSPDTVKRLRGVGFDVVVETGAGAGSTTPDSAYTEAGASIADDAASCVADADVVLKVQRPMTAAEGNDELLMSCLTQTSKEIFTDNDDRTMEFLKLMNLFYLCL